MKMAPQFTGKSKKKEKEKKKRKDLKIFENWLSYSSIKGVYVLCPL